MQALICAYVWHKVPDVPLFLSAIRIAVSFFISLLSINKLSFLGATSSIILCCKKTYYYSVWCHSSRMQSQTSRANAMGTIRCSVNAPFTYTEYHGCYCVRFRGQCQAPRSSTLTVFMLQSLPYVSVCSSALSSYLHHPAAHHYLPAYCCELHNITL